jgi:hypothetical protein
MHDYYFFVIRFLLHAGLASQEARGLKNDARSDLVAGSGLSGLSGSSGSVVAVASGGARCCSSSGTAAAASREAN